MAKSKRMTVYGDAVTVRKHNKKIVVQKTADGSLMLNFAVATTNPQDPAVSHKTLKKKVRISQLKISEESFIDLMAAYMTLKSNQNES